MKHNLKKAGVSFLIYEKQCMLVCFERGVYYDYFRPDLLGVTKDRKLIEIEIKKTFEDFKANFEKKCIWYYKHYPENSPHYFYFLVSPEIVEKVLNYENINHGGYGVLSIDKNNQILHHRKVILNKYAKKVSLKSMSQMVKNQTRSFISLWEELEKKMAINNFQRRTPKLKEHLREYLFYMNTSPTTFNLVEGSKAQDRLIAYMRRYPKRKTIASIPFFRKIINLG